MKILLLAALCTMPLFGILKNHFEIRLIEVENELERKISVYDEADRLMTHVFPRQSLSFSYVLSAETITRSRSIHTGQVEAKFSNIATSRAIRIETEPFFQDNTRHPATVLLLNSDISFDQYTGKVKVEIGAIDYHTRVLLAQKTKIYDAFKDRTVRVKLEVEKPKTKTYPVSIDLDIED